MASGNPATRRSHHVCVRCRLSLKRNGSPAACPGCGVALTDAGVCLAVPSRRDRDGWRALGAVLEAGLRFHPRCGCCYDGPGYRPRTMAEVRARLAFADRAGLPVAEALALEDLTRAAPDRDRGPNRATTRS
ncbi:hypothetical protein FM076_02915 [Streptomyces albus subsp. chlorinus]|uniref:hypothetical protein n=1 Tax=Streptomyces albus TaxID=1888 RepID=UPI00156DAAE1|nr:hypothetical protein [Streptomyces albus]NSC20218.1 hypothetical protein [Streptomyces albus subsp. chlorinus]